MIDRRFEIQSDWPLSGDQPSAVDALTKGYSLDGKQTLLGVTGSGKTFTIANVIQNIQKPTLVIAHNKTLAAQLAQEYSTFFPNNSVHYFVSYYDYYQPEAYLPVTDTYIEKEAQINEEIDRLRHASTQALLTRRDVIVVASVSCIYGLGSPEQYKKYHLPIVVGDSLSREDLMRQAIRLHFKRTTGELRPGSFRSLGNMVDIVPTNEEIIYRFSFQSGKVVNISKIDLTTSEMTENNVPSYFLFPAKHFMSSEDERSNVISLIEKELGSQLKKFKGEGKEIEAERLRRRTLNDISLIREVGYCAGIENYSRFFDGRKTGDPPYTLISYFPKVNGVPDFLTVIDESHVTVPQLSGMYAGDAARKRNLIDYGFRVPSAADNRPLKFDEFNERVGHIIFTSATPREYEKESSKKIVEQVIRPTGLVDPELHIHPVVGIDGKPGQIYHFIEQAKKHIKKKGRVIVTALTKKNAEELSAFLKEKGVNAQYIHSDVKTIERVEILTSFRKGEFDVLVGVNLLREGLDIPETTLVAILDADKEGFLRSTTSLIQTIGRAARNVNGEVWMYADRITNSMETAIEETKRRRGLQLEYNKENNITPKTISKKIADITSQMQKKHKEVVHELLGIDMELFNKDPKVFIKSKEEQMEEAVKNLDFETAAIIRDELSILKEREKAKKPLK